MITRLLTAAGAMAALLAAQGPFHAESTSSINLNAKDGEQTVEIHNVAYRFTGAGIPGRPPDQRLTLRTTTHSKDIVGDINDPGSVTLEAWPFGTDLKQKPLYAVKLGGSGAQTIDNAIWLVDRGYTDVAMWSIYKLGTGRHLFDTHAELLRFSITRDVQTPRYVGLEAPPDDTPDARLKEPHVVAVLTYASDDRVIRELLITHANPRRALELRSYADTARTVSAMESPARRLRILFTANDPGAAAVEVVVPIKGDDLDAAGARAPSGIRLAAWRR